MIAKTVTYEDFNGNERTEKLYFHLSKSEMIKLEKSTPGGYYNKLKKIVEEKNEKELIQVFSELIEMSYGIKSDDGKRFIKNKEITEEFTQSNAYEELFMELATNEEAAIKFMEGIIPATK